MALDKGTRPTYVHTMTKFILYMARRSQHLLSRLPSLGGVATHVTSFALEPTAHKLHTLLMDIFNVWADEPEERDDHLIGNYLKFAAVLPDGNFVQMSTTRHTVVHMMYWARLAIFREVRLHGHQEENLRRVHTM